MQMLVSTGPLQGSQSEQPFVHTPGGVSATAQQSQLKQIFTDLHEFEVGELSRLCISKDYFPTPKR